MQDTPPTMLVSYCCVSNVVHPQDPVLEVSLECLDLLRSNKPTTLEVERADLSNEVHPQDPIQKVSPKCLSSNIQRAQICPYVYILVHHTRSIIS